jgi:thiol-disulfide isomerase/thioredoxin
MHTHFDESVKYLEDEDFTSDGKLKIDPKKPVIIMIMGNFCGWCKKAQPEFQKFADSAGHVYPACILIDGNASEKKLGNRIKSFIPNYQGVPMFVCFKNGKFVKEHTGERTAKALIEFSMSV